MNCCRSLSLLLCFGAAAIACGGDDGGGSSADASVADASPDADPASFCEIVEFEYGDLGTLAGTATIAPIDDLDPQGPQQLRLQMPLNNDAMPDVMFLELYEGEPPFDNGIETGTFTIIDDQTDLVACSVCAYLAGDFVDLSNVNFHMASSGAVSITAVDTTPGTGSIVGSIQNLALREVTVSANGQQVVPMGCRLTIGSLAFDLTIEAE